MNLTTGLTEFYPRTADDAARGNELDAVVHSLKKWEGLLDANLAKHRLMRDGYVVRDDTSLFIIDAVTCALCARHPNTCSGCALNDHLNDRSCTGREDAPYTVYRRTGNPKPMIQALRATSDMLRARGEVPSE